MSKQNPRTLGRPGHARLEYKLSKQRFLKTHIFQLDPAPAGRAAPAGNSTFKSRQRLREIELPTDRFLKTRIHQLDGVYKKNNPSIRHCEPPLAVRQSILFFKVTLDRHVGSRLLAKTMNTISARYAISPASHCPGKPVANGLSFTSIR